MEWNFFINIKSWVILLTIVFLWLLFNSLCIIVYYIYFFFQGLSLKRLEAVQGGREVRKYKGKRRGKRRTWGWWLRTLVLWIYACIFVNIWVNSIYIHVCSYIAHMFPYILREVGFAHSICAYFSGMEENTVHLG